MTFPTRLSALFICSALLYLKPSSCNAQEYLDNFHPLSTSQEIPQNVLQPTFPKISEAQLKAASKKYESNSEKKDVNHFLNNSYYEIDYLMRSGQIIFNNEITAYLNQVADLVLKDESELRDRIEIYLLKSTEVNAYATPQGFIFISIGLLAQLETESQLAFIIAHEIQHIRENHSLKYVLTESNKEKRTYQYKSESTDKVDIMSSYSRKQESEADSVGFERAIRAGYKATGAITSMDVLQLSFIPFTNNKFNFQLLESGEFKIPSWAIADSTRAIPYNTDSADDSESTHPNIQSRRQALNENSLNKDGGKNFIISKETFEKTMLLSRFEIVFLHLVEGDYASSLYLSNVLLQKYPNNQFLEEAFAKSLYGAYAYKANDKRTKANLVSRRQYSEMQRMTNYFENIDNLHFGIIVLKELCEVEEKYKNPYITKITNDFIGMYQKESEINYKELVEKMNYSKSLIQKEMNVELGALKAKIVELNKKNRSEKEQSNTENSPGDQNSNDNAISDSKYQSLRDTRNVNSGNDELIAYDNLDEIPNWLDHYSFIGFNEINKTGLEARFDSISKIYNEKEEDIENLTSHYEKKEKKFVRRGFKMAMDSLLVVDPWYIDLKVTYSDYTVKNVDDEQHQFASIFESELSRQNVHHQLLAWPSMNESDTDKFNDFAAMNDWYKEINRHANNDVNMLAITTDYFTPVLNKYHCKYVVFPGATKIKAPREKNGPPVISVLSVFAPIALPATLHRVHTEHYSNNYFYYVYNLENGTMVWHHNVTMPGKQNIFDTSNYFKDLIFQSINY